MKPTKRRFRGMAYGTKTFNDILNVVKNVCMRLLLIINLIVPASQYVHEDINVFVFVFIFVLGSAPISLKFASKYNSCLKTRMQNYVLISIMIRPRELNIGHRCTA